MKDEEIAYGTRVADLVFVHFLKMKNLSAIPMILSIIFSFPFASSSLAAVIQICRSVGMCSLAYSTITVTRTKRCRLSLLTNSALIYESKCGKMGGGEVSANDYRCAQCTSRDM
jgi:hypothetical protein